MKKSVHKKLISLILSIAMVCTLFTQISLAADSQDYSDYIPGEMPEDLIPGGWVYGDTNDSNVSFGWSGIYGSDTRYYAKGTVAYTATTNNWSAGGTIVSSAKINGGEALSPNTTYVFGAKVRNAGASGTTPKYGIYYHGKTQRCFPNEYGAEGWTPSGEFEDYIVTFSTGENASGAIVSGFVNAVEGDEVHMNYSYGMYLGVETPYDITVDITGNNVLYAGESTTLKTQVVNQLYTKGTIDQSVSYVVLNSDRTQIADGFTVTKGADGTATVAVSDEVLTGEYVVVALSDTYSQLKKGAKISVLGAGAFRDYTPGEKPANLVLAHTFTASNSKNVSMAQVGTEFRWTETASAPESWWAVIPTMLTASNKNFDATLYSDKSYVLSARLCNPTADTRPDMKFAVGSGNVKLFEIPVANSRFETKKMVFSPTTDISSVAIGIDGKTDRSSYTDLGTIAIDLSGGGSLYIAEEVPYDITVEPQTPLSAPAAGESFVLEAKVVNQIGLCGTLSQEFEWYALNADKTKNAPSIVITPGDNGRTATVTLKDDVPSGTYAIVAKSKNYDNFIRTYYISTGAVEEYIPGDKPQNMILAPANINRYLQNNGAGGEIIQDDWQKDQYIRWTEKARDTNAYWRVGPTIMTTDLNDNPGLSTAFVKGQNYVVSVRLKNDTPELGEAKFGIANAWEHLLTIPVTSTEYETYTATFTATQNAVSICLGFDAREATEGGRIINVDISDGGSLYIAPEVAYDIVTDADSAVITHDEVLSASATLVNQLGNKGKLPQNFEWFVLDSNKAEYDGYFEIDVSDDTAEATVRANSRVPTGTYYLAARSAENSSMVKLIEFKLKKDPITYYVAPYGDDNGDGTIAAPFATIARAKAAVASIEDKNAYRYIDVVLRGGEYRIKDTLTFTQTDSGADETIITYKAYEGEKPVIKGSVTLDTSRIREALSSDIVGRLHPNAQGKVMVIDLGEQGLTDSDIFDMSAELASFYALSEKGELNSIFADGVAQTLSCWPNDRNYSVRGSAIIDETYTDTDGKTVKVSTSFNYTESEPDRWANAKGWYIGAFMPYDYSYARLSVDYIDTANKVLKVHGRSDNKKDFNFTNNFSKRWKAFNLIEEIDLPGEYAIDSENKLLYYYPPHDMKNATLEIATMFDSLISVSGARNITFDGISFAQTNGVAVSMTDVDNVDIRNCTFSGIGETAVSIRGSMKAQTNKDYWQRQDIDGSYNCDITDCVFTNLGNSAITVSGGNVDTLRKSNNIIENNFIYDFSNKTLASSNGAIALGGCGNTVRNNNISVSPGIAILIHGNDHLVEYNEIYDVMREVQDAGAIYQGRNALARGSVIRYNYLHDLRSLDTLTSSAQVGIYLDDAQQGLTITNNIIKNVKIDFNSNGAAAFTFSGNTSIDIDKAWNFLNHASTASSTVTTGPSGTLEFIESQIYDKELYFERYPELEEFLNKDRVPGNNPKYFTVAEDNIAVNANATNIQSENLAYSTFANNECITDTSYSIFADAQNQDYRIKNSSQYASDARLTESFDIEKIGIQSDLTLADVSEGFDTVYPAIGDTVANGADGVDFLWNAYPGATFYTLTIADDAEFDNIVYTTDTRLTSAKVNGLATGKTYYWMVEATSTSREFADSRVCDNSTSYFVLRDFVSDLSLSNVSMDTYDTLTLLDAVVTNNCQTQVSDFDIILAAYSGNSLVASQRIAKTIPKGQSERISANFDTEGQYIIEEIKIFVWGKDKLTPYAKVRVLK